MQLIEDFEDLKGTNGLIIFFVESTKMEDMKVEFFWILKSFKGFKGFKM